MYDVSHDKSVNSSDVMLTYAARVDLIVPYSKIAVGVASYKNYTIT